MPHNIQLIIFDIDGVLTDGRIIVDDQGFESKHFHVRDGFAIRTAMAVGLQVGVITGRSSRCVTLRMGELGVDLLLQGVRDKAAGLARLCEQTGVEPHQAAYLGDDLIDLPAMRRCGYPMAVADAVEEVKAQAVYVTNRCGGQGAAREALEHILKTQNKWEQVVARYQ